MLSYWRTWAVQLKYIGMIYASIKKLGYKAWDLGHPLCIFCFGEDASAAAHRKLNLKKETKYLPKYVCAAASGAE